MAVLRRQTSGKKPPRAKHTDVLRPRGVPGKRLPLSQALLEEDSICPNRCGGKMLITPDGECTCFRRAPCRACENAYLKCSDCGFEYRNTAEDNMVVAAVFALWPQRQKKAVDFPSFSLYDIHHTPKHTGRRREVKEID